MLSSSVMRDYHIHTSLCNHASGSMEEYVQEAINTELSEIAFCDHIPLPDGFDTEHRMKLSELDFYLNEIERLRNVYPEISILCGIEADYIAGYESFLEGFLNQYNFDIILMSVHFVEGWSGGNWVFDYNFPAKTVREIYCEYLRSVSKGIQTGLFDIVAHLDIVKRDGFPLMELCPEEVEATLDLIKSEGMALEVNTSGLRKGIKEIFPSHDIVKMGIDKEIPLSLASDAHKPEQVGYHFREILTELEKCGSFKYVQHKRRKKQLQI